MALTSFLERHPEIRRVTLYMDRDLAGFVNARKIKTMLHEDKRFRHIRVSVNPPRMGKDYNEKLLGSGTTANQPAPTPPKRGGCFNLGRIST